MAGESAGYFHSGRDFGLIIARLAKIANSRILTKLRLHKEAIPSQGAQPGNSVKGLAAKG
jgi:hypothetical protein